MRLTKNIWLRELRQRARHGFRETLYPVKWHARAVKVARIVQAARDHFGRPAVIVSGYRSPPYNRSIGGSRASQHMIGQAIDFKIRTVPAARVHAWILAEYRAGRMPDLGGLGAYPGFTHVDIRPRKRHLSRWAA